MQKRLSKKLFMTFLFLIMIGTILLYMFGLNQNIKQEHFMAALFSAVSAVCVTGLSIIDISKDLNIGGQIILLILIQLGGLGLITLSNWIILSLSGQLSLEGTIFTQDIIGSMHKLTPKKILKRVILFTLISEISGTILLYLCFIQHYSHKKALWLGLFHSVSAFCNAGFSLFSHSFVDYSNSFAINFILMILIIFGGIGFVVAIDVIKLLKSVIFKTRWVLSFHSSIVLKVTSILIILGTVGIFLFEYNNALSGNIIEKILKSLFLSITSRTAGFNTIQTESLTGLSLIFLMMLMFIGASPGSAGGGIKTTSIAIIIASLRGLFLNRSRTELCDRSISNEHNLRAFGVVTLYLTLAFLSIAFLHFTETSGVYSHSNLSLDISFEVISALSTVGLSTGITPMLSYTGKLIIILCMFVGRIGPAILVATLISKQRVKMYTYPIGDIMVG